VKVPDSLCIPEARRQRPALGGLPGYDEDDARGQRDESRGIDPEAAKEPTAFRTAIPEHDHDDRRQQGGDEGDGLRPRE
jgi:hypothetical protein